MAGYPYLYESLYGAGFGYADMGYDPGAMSDYGTTHTHFVVWLAVFTLAAVAVLGGLKVAGFHFVVKV